MRVKLAYGREKLWVEFPQDTPVNVAQVLQSLQDRQPDVYASWCNKEGRLRRSLAVFINREHMRYRQGFETWLSDGDEVYVVPLICGG
jgi:molybdopterin converting factor small subunit